MNVTANFYINTSDKRCLFKTITSVFSANFVFYENSSIHIPRLRLSYNPSIHECNYLYIPELERFYFIDNINYNSGGEMIVTGHIDVLQTYQKQIENLTCTISRYENYDLSLLPDTNILLKNYNIINIYKSEQAFDTTIGNYVLQIVGG